MSYKYSVYLESISRGAICCLWSNSGQGTEYSTVLCHGIGTLCKKCPRLFMTCMLSFSVSDASGRYSSEFFFGNDFWLGSYEQCQELRYYNATPFPLQFRVARLQISLAKNLTPVVSLCHFVNQFTKPHLATSFHVVLTDSLHYARTCSPYLSF